MTLLMGGVNHTQVTTEPTDRVDMIRTKVTMTMTTTHSEKSHIRRMKAWRYRQECRGHDPTKKNLFC